MKTKTQIVIVTSILAILTGILLAIVHLPQKGKEREILVNHLDIALWAVAGIVILALIVFGLRKLGASPGSWFPSWLKGIVAIAVISGFSLWIYHDFDSVKKGGRETIRILNNGISKSIFIGKVEDLPIKIETSDMETGYYRLSIYPDPGKESYWGDCDEGKSLRGHAVDNESVRKRVENSREGNIVVMSGTGRSRHGDLVYVQKNSSFTITLDLAGITVGKNCVINLGARLHFIPEKV
jgi:hypothetical protein